MGIGFRPLHSLCISYFVLHDCVVYCVNYIHGRMYIGKYEHYG